MWWLEFGVSDECGGTCSCGVGSEGVWQWECSMPTPIRKESDNGCEGMRNGRVIVALTDIFTA